MHFIFKFIPIISSTCFEQINYSSSAGSLLHMQSMVFIVHTRWLAANTIRVDIYWNKFKKQVHLVGSYCENLPLFVN